MAVSQPTISGIRREWPWINARTYGATGDGVTDDRSAIVSALAAVPAGGALYLPRGVYRLSSTIEINRSDITIVGDGPMATLLKPDESQADGSAFTNLFYFKGASGSHLSNVCVEDIGIDGSNRPVDPSGGYGRIRFEWVDGIICRNIRSKQGHGTITLRGCTGFAISGIHVTDNAEGIVALLAGCNKGTITDFVGDGVGEGIDLYDDEDVVISNGVVIGNDPDNNEAIDLSSSRRITISNVIGRGTYRGITVKTEGGVAWRDLVINNCQMHETTLIGIYISVQSPAPAAACGEIVIDNCVIKSTATGATGISSATQTNRIDNVTIRGCQIDVPGHGISVRGMSKVEIVGNMVVSGDVPIFVGETSTPSNINVSVCGNTVTSTSATNSDAAIFAQTTENLLIRDNVVVSSTCYGIRARNCRRPIVQGNEIRGCAQHGIEVVWSGTTYLDTTNSRMDAVIDNNIVRNWGSATTNRVGILLSTNITGDTTAWRGASVSGNRLFVETGNSQIGVAFSKASGQASIDYVKFDNNLIFAPTATNGAGSLANSTSSNNTSTTV